MSALAESRDAGAAQAALQIEGLDVSYGAVTVVHDVCLSVGPGEAVAVIGSNGAGKTSMLRGIMNLAEATARRLEFDGHSIRGLPTHQVAGRGVGYVPEGRELFPTLTVMEELQVGGRHLSQGARAAKLDEVFEMFPRLKERRGQVACTMSGGEQQMLAIARILMRDPALLLLDEPSLGLAPVIQDIVYETLGRLRDRGMPMLLVEQNAFRALKLCARAYVLELGRVRLEGRAGDLLEDPSIQQAYLGS